MSSSYYDLDDILTDAQKVPCTFEIDVPGLGFLDNNAGGDVRKGTSVSLPLWLGSFLAPQTFGNQTALSIDLPTSLSPRVLNALKADARTVDLRAQAPHYYALAAMALELFEEDEIVDVLLETFKVRAKEIHDRALNTRAVGGEAGGFLRGLDEQERYLFKGAHESAKAMRVWMGEAKKK